MSDGRPERPRFRDANAWLYHYQEAKAGEAWPPVTRNELLVAEREGILAIHKEWIPSQRDRQMMELPNQFGTRVEPFGEWSKRRLLATFATDGEFREEVCKLLEIATLANRVDRMAGYLNELKAEKA